MRTLFVFFLLSITASAQDFILATRTAWGGNVPENVRVLSFEGPRRQWSDDLKDYCLEHPDLIPTRYPSLIWLKAGVIVPVTGTVAQAKQDCKASLTSSKPDFWTRAEKRYTNSVNDIAALVPTNVVAAALTPWDIYKLLQDVPASNRVAAYRSATEATLIIQEIMLRQYEADARGRRLSWIESLQQQQ